MHFLKTIAKKRTLMLSILTIFAFVAMAQDQLASVAPIDKRMRAIDSVSIAKMLEKETMDYSGMELYPNWNNTYTMNYGVEMPKEYKIDLRNFHFPCESRRVTSSYGYRRSFRRNHYGTDIKVYVGDTIRAAFSGKIRIVANQGRRKGYGKYIVIRHYNGLETVYGHLSKQLVVEEQEVKAGEPIGLGGNTGRSTGSHLHFETRFLGKFIDPEKMFDFTAQDVLADYYLFSSVGRSRLLTSNESQKLPSNTVLASVGGPTFEADKEEESKKFQEERRQSLRTSVHRVAKGESLSTIARKRGTTVAKLCKLNNISTKTVLRVGQILKCS